MARAVSIERVSKRFILHHERATSWQERFLSMVRQRSSSTEEFWALRDISFAIEHGQSVGLVGPNGTGKSTLLKLIGRIMLPTSGAISVHGRVATLLELGAGFHPDLSGIENIYLNGSLLGLSRADVSKRIDAIAEFSELGTFLDTPVKHYSSGMYVRLGFSIAVNLDPDILLIDEALSVGDENFQKKSAARFDDLREQGKTLIIVTHSMEQVKKWCDRAVWIQGGYLKADDQPEYVIEQYLDFSAKLLHAIHVGSIDGSNLGRYTSLDEFWPQTQELEAQLQAEGRMPDNPLVTGRLGRWTIPTDPT